MNPFDEKAASWDSNPTHYERSQAICLHLKNRIPLNNTMTALEFGAGTAILSFLMKDDLKEITLMDNSSGMVDVMQRKVQTLGATHLKPLFFDMEHSDYNGQTFDLIYTQLVMHHIADTNAMIKKFYDLLNPGGYLAIADLYTEEGLFHDSSFNLHKGFDPILLGQFLSSIGFTDVNHEQCFVINKLTSENTIKEFPLFLLTARKGNFESTK